MKRSPKITLINTNIQSYTEISTYDMNMKELNKYQSDNQSFPIIARNFSSNAGSSSSCHCWSKVD